MGSERKRIALCGAADDIKDILEQGGNYQISRFEDGHPESGFVKLAYFLQSGGTVPDLILIDYKGAAGLAACDFLYDRQNAPPILWLCDRKEFEPEAERMGVSFLHTGPPPYQEKDTILKAIGDLLAKASASEEYRRSEVVQ